MSWLTPFAGLKKKICRYLLQRYLGQFLEEKLNLEQLNVDLYNGTGSVSDVALNCEALNELCEDQGWGVEVTGGHIGNVIVTVPWNALMTDDSRIEVHKLCISLKPTPRQTDGASMFESMWSSMSSSMQLAKECLENDGDESDVQMNTQGGTIEGLEKFAQTIDNVLNRIKAKLIDTEIRLEYVLPDSDHGIAIIIKINELNYQNEAGSDPPDNVTATASSSVEDEMYEDQKTHLISSYATHHISLEGIQIFTEEFRIVNTSNQNISSVYKTDNLVGSEQFYSTISHLPEPEQHLASNEIKLKSSTVTLTEENTIEIYSSESIMMACLDGKQEIRIKMKQSENIYGPKVHLDMQFGALIMFLTPRQLHLIVKFCNTFLQSDQKQESQRKIDDAEVRRKRRNELQKMQKRYSSMSGVIGGRNENFWSDPSSANIISDTEFKSSVQIPKLSHTTGTGSASFEYCESMSSSMTSSSAASSSTRFRHKLMSNTENSGDISHFNLRISNIFTILLHEDILLENSSNLTSTDNPLSKESVSNLVTLSRQFFNDALANQTNLSSTICSKNHLKLHLTPIIIDGEQQRSNNVIILKLTASITKIDFDEVLQNSSMSLIKFKREENCSGGLHKRPEFMLNLKTINSTNGKISSSSTSASNSKKNSHSKMDFRVTLEPCIIELDVSLYDRLNFILDSSPFHNPNQINFDLNNSETGFTTTPPVTTNKHGEPLAELKIEASSLEIRLRFPIVDSRPLHDPDRIPWWKQNIRPDFLLFNFHQFRFSFSHSAIEILANQIDVFYCENYNSSKIHVAQTILVNKKGLGINESSMEYPSISIIFPSDKSLKTTLKLNVDDSDSGETSGESCALFSKRPKEFLPFSAKRVCRQSDTPHVKTGIDESETILLPGESTEMKKFCDRSMKTSKLQIKVFLPIGSAQIDSKHLYEILYNRLNTDLLMWEPIASNLAQSRKAKYDPPVLQQSLLNVGMMDSMYVPSTTTTVEASEMKKEYQESSSLESSSNSDGNVSDDGVNENDDDEDDDDDDDSDDRNLYYSAYCDKKRSSSIKRNQSSAAASSSSSSLMLLSACSFDLQIDQGILTLFAPVRDNENRILPGQLGEFILKANSFNLFSVSGYNGNKNLAYLCMQIKSAEIYHCGLISNPDYHAPLRLFSVEIPLHVQATLYPTPTNSTLTNSNHNTNDNDDNSSDSNKKREMLSLAIEIRKMPEQRIKRLRITTGIKNTTLKHNPATSQQTWLNQIIDMFDVLDYPIEGYKPYSIVTEMQLHLWDCAVDYRPLNFGYRAIAEFGSLMISSNLTTKVTGCTLRFIAEECALSLAPYDFKTYRDKPKNKIIILPSKELVSVLDLGLLDISLRLNEKATELFPKFDLRASIQDMHIRTCSDSGQALAHLIAYLANDGDLLNPSEEEAPQDVDNETNLLSVKECKVTVPEITAQQQERVNTLMAEALQETVNIISESDDDEFKMDRGVEVFFFPDETHQLKKSKEDKDTVSLKSDGSSATLRPSTSSAEVEIKSEYSPSELTLEKDKSGKSITKSESDEWNFGAAGSTEESQDNNEICDELHDLMNFETSVMCKSYNVHEEAVEALPQIQEEFGIPSQHQETFLPTTESNSKQQQGRKNSFTIEDDFYFIPDEDKAFLSNCGKEVEISNDPLRIVDNHFSLPMNKPDLLKAPENFPMAVMRYTLCEMTLTWHLYGGNDFPITDEQKLNEKHDDEEIPSSLKPMSDAYKVGVSYSKSRQSVQFGNKKPITKMSWKTRGGYKRNHEVLIEIQLTKVKLSHEIYPTHTTQASRQVVIISELEIRDRLQSSEINKFLYHPSPRHLSNKSSQHMVVIKALHVRPNPILPTQECSLRLSLLPLRLNIDQDALLFLVQFFNELSSGTDELNRKQHPQQLQPPVMMVDDVPEAVQDLKARQMISTNLNLLMEDDEPNHKTEIQQEAPQVQQQQQQPQQESTNDSPIYFKEIVFSPEVLIRLDYHGRRIEMSRGPIAGLLMGLGQLQCSEIRLKKICYRHGILGLDRLLNFLLQEWLKDIKKNQLPSILSGVGPMYTLVQLIQGIRDLFWLPIEQYQKDGRIVRGLQLGAQSFTARTALAALEITARIIQLLQVTAETAFDMVSPGPSVRRSRHNRKNKRKRPHRPQDIREGVANAYQIVKEGINETANTLIETTAAEHDQKGYAGAVGAVFRQIPPIALRPVVLATQATTNVLGGVKNQLVPDARFEAKEKWKEDTE